MKRLYELDLIRIIAAAMVFMLHATIFYPDMKLLLQKKISFLLYPSAWGGVWIFFVLGGFLAGKKIKEIGPVKSSILLYYKRRFMKVVVPTICYTFFSVLFVFPDFVVFLPEYTVRFITSSYKGIPGKNVIGATWYVSALIFFYLVTPFFEMIIRNMKKKWCFFIIVLLGLLIRLILYYLKVDWNKHVYSTPLANIDLWIGGMFIAHIDTKKKSKVLPKILFMATILVNSICNLNMKFGSKQSAFVVMYLFQTVYLVVLYFVLTNIDDHFLDKKPFWGKVVSFLSAISFEFYLFHCLVLYLWTDVIVKYLILPGVWGYFEYLLSIILLTMISALGFKITMQSLMNILNNRWIGRCNKK